MTIDLNDEERDALIGLLNAEIEASRFPLSPRIERLKRIRDKLRESQREPTAAPPRRRRT